MRAFAYVEQIKAADISGAEIRFVLRYRKEDIPEKRPKNFATLDQLTFEVKLEEAESDGDHVISHRLPFLLSHHERYIDDTCAGCPVYKQVTRVPYDEYRSSGMMPEPLVIPPLSQRV